MAFFASEGGRQIMETNHPKDKNSPDGNDDKRYFPRWQVSNRVFYQLEKSGRSYECRSRDLNCAGACLLTDQGIAANQKVKLTIDLSDAVSVDVEGRTLWCRPVAGRNLTGIIFTNVKPEVQDSILDYAFEVKKEDVVKHWFKGWNGK